MTLTRMIVSLGTAACCAALLSTSSLAQSPSGPTKAPRTPWGDPDLQGTWSSEAELSVPFERPAQYGERQVLTDQEFAARLAQTEKQIQSDNSEFDIETADRSNAGAVGSATSPPPHWLERGKTSRRTSIVIDPPDGRIPPLVAAARQRAQGPRGTFGASTFNGPEDLSLWERCISRGMPTAIFPTVYNANVRLVQGPGVVAITYEMIHDTRVIPIDIRAHTAAGVRGYFGDSRGHWEGDTLVVDVTNINDKGNYRGSRDTLHLIERWTRVGSNLRYEVTADDPQTWAKPWTAALEMAPQPEGMFEYACHEGNNSMRNILSAARAAEKSK
jgi:hypothetical protein